MLYLNNNVVSTVKVVLFSNICRNNKQVLDETAIKNNGSKKMDMCDDSFFKNVPISN